jgi:uncharacterized membrane protein YkgB
MLSRTGSVLLKIGGLGFLLGFASWTAWAVMAVLSFNGILLYGDNFGWMSGVFFQAPASRLIFYGLLSLSSLFSAVGCFALAKIKASWVGLVSGILFVATFLVTVAYMLPFYGLKSGIYPYPYPALSYETSFSLSFFSGIILWGVTLSTTAGKMGTSGLNRATGAIFVFSGFLGIVFMPVILYWGFEIWLLMLGWLYAAGTLMTTLIFFRLPRTPQKPSPTP